MTVHPFPLKRVRECGTIHVWGTLAKGFDVSHESRSGGSWGGVEHYVTGQEAIASAYALNRDAYGSECDVSVCDAAMADTQPDLRPPVVREDF